MRRDVKKKNKNGIGLALVLAVMLFFATAVLYFIINGGKSSHIYKTADYIAETSCNEISEIRNMGMLILTGKYTKEEGINYSRVFEKSVILGDSITEGLKVYGFLGEEQVYCEIGGSVMNSKEVVKKAAVKKPEIAFFSYGTNDMGMFSGNAEAFIEKYSSVIEEFMDISPDTKIYVNSISKPSDSKIASGGHFHKWEEFNEAIENMCSSIGAEYIDNTEILEKHPELYAGDGIHVSSAYYPYWMDNMIKKAKLLSS